MAPQDSLTFLVVRRDNIGDLVCTTPVFTALRKRFPSAKIYALTNTYNMPILANNPYIDGAYAYMKAHHRDAHTSLWSVYRRRLQVVLNLRGAKIDYAILASWGLAERALRFVRLAKPKHIVGYVAERGAKGIDIPLQYKSAQALHEVEGVFRVLEPLGIDGPPPPLSLTPVSAEVARAQAVLNRHGITSAADNARERPVAIHISARLPSNRWPTKNFVSFIRRLAAEQGRQFLLLWSPGDASNPLHPGDDAKAKEIIDATGDLAIAAYPTRSLEELIAALSLCDKVVCSDGGAMHIAAALQKPIVCFFGDSNAGRWHPWGVPHAVLQPPTRRAEDVSVEQTIAAFSRLTAG